MILLLLASLGWANGCVWDEIATARPGSLAPRRVSRTTLVAETLSVAISGDSVRVRARYHLRNDGPAVKGVYAAPVDYAPSDFGNQAEGRDGWDRRLWSRATLSLDGAPPRPLSGSGPSPRKDPDRPWRRWFSTRLELPPGDHVLELSTLSSASFADTDEKGVTGIRYFSAREFEWDLSPASRWGNGRVGTLVVQVDARALAPDSIPLQSDLPPAFARRSRDGIDTWTARDLDLASVRPLSWRWVPGLPLTEAFLRPKLWTGARWRGSADLPAYPLSNLTDGNWSTAWVAPGGGRGAWIETDVPRGVGIAGVLIAPGYAKSPALWTENDRIVLLRATFPGRTPVRTDIWGRLSSSERDTLPDRLGRMRFINSAECASDETPPGGILRLEIDSTIPGTRSRDVPVSEIAILRCPPSSSP